MPFITAEGLTKRFGGTEIEIQNKIAVFQFGNNAFGFVVFRIDQSYAELLTDAKKGDDHGPFRVFLGDQVEEIGIDRNERDIDVGQSEFPRALLHFALLEFLIDIGNSAGNDRTLGRLQSLGRIRRSLALG